MHWSQSERTHRNPGYQLHNGDIVEIITLQDSNGPTRGWLNFVKTSSARSPYQGLV